MIRTNEAIASIIDDQKMIGSRMLNELCHLHSELGDWVRAARYTPRLGTIVETFAEDLLECHQVWLNAQIVFPSQEEDRDVCVDGSIGLRINEHRCILQMASKGLEVGALGRRCAILDRRQRLVVVLYLRRLDILSVCRSNMNRDGSLTCSWSGFSATLGARRRFLLEGSMVARPTQRVSRAINWRQ